MYKLIDPFDGKTIGFSELKIEDEAVVKTWVDASGIRQFEKRYAACEETADTPTTLFAAEEWLTIQGYSSMRLVTLLDLENKLHAASRNSPKLTATRTWINGILAAFIEHDSHRDNWPPAPFGFQETTTEAFATLTASHHDLIP